LTLKPIGTEKRISRLNKDLAIECRKTIRVAYLEKPVVPVTYGVRKPVIILPAMLMMSCTDMQSEIQQDVLDEEINMQEVYNEEKDFYRVTEEMPELIGGLSGVQENLEYPEEAMTAGLEGNVYVRFIINRRGEVEDATVIRGIGEGPDEAALKAVEQARFRPGRHKGETIRVQYSLPINFKLNHRLK
ncbi:MAG: M56 family metallopeptidase, partial [Balneolaceae bacterium]